MTSPLISPLVFLAGTSPIRSVANTGLAAYSRRRVAEVDALNPAETQRKTLETLVKTARATRFGRDHSFAKIRTIADFQAAVPLRKYEDIWKDYLEDQYPIFQDLTWPGRVPYLALTSGTTQGATKYIPVTRAMNTSNRKGALTMISRHVVARPDSRLFHGKLFFLGGSTDLEKPGPGVQQGDLSGIAAKEVSPFLRAYTFPPLEAALDPDWDRKLKTLVQLSVQQPITLLAGVPSWLLVFFEKVLARTGKKTIAEVWPTLELIVHGGVKFDPYRSAFEQFVGAGVAYQETYPCSEGFIAYGDRATGLLRIVFDHGIFYEFVPVDELDRDQPTRLWLGDVKTGVNYAIIVSTCAGMWSHIIGDTIRFETLDPPMLTFTGRTKYTLSAFGEHLISEEVEGAIAAASAATGASARDWHAGPVFVGTMGYHIYVIEFLKPPVDLALFRSVLDSDLLDRNADYRAHRAEGVGLPLPMIVTARPGGFDDWMRSRGKLGGQNKVPRMDDSGKLTAELVAFLRSGDRIADELAAGPIA